jgi:RNA polymerase sigma-70 factor (ECF subfamily)
MLMSMEDPVKDQTDAQLVAGCREGDKEAFATLVRRHSRRVFAVCLGMLGEVPDSEDAVQDVFLRGMINLHALRDEEKFAGWIVQMARNHCRDILRKRRRHRLLSQPDLQAAGTDDESSDLHVALAGLPEEYRLPLMLFYFDGRSTKSVANALSLSQAGACTRLSRARKQLRRLLEERGYRG